MIDKRRCSWRYRLVLDRKRRKLRTCLMAMIILECSFGAAQFIRHRFDTLPIIKVEDSVKVEWFVPTETDLQGVQEGYGIQLDKEEGVLRFFHSRQQINGH